MDPPQHRKLRTLVSQAFTPKVVAGLEPRIAELTTELLDRVGERFDLIDALAYPLPVVVIAELLGIPTSDRALFRTWADVLLSQEIDPDQALGQAGERAVAAVAPTMREMNAYFLDHIRSRRAEPGSRPDQQAGAGRGGRAAAGRRGDRRFRRAAADRGPHHDHRDAGQQRGLLRRQPRRRRRDPGRPDAAPGGDRGGAPAAHPVPARGADHQGRHRGGRRRRSRPGRSCCPGWPRPTGTSGCSPTRTGSTSTAGPTRT